MSEPFAHLTPGARNALALPVAERIAHMKKERWINYPRAETVLQSMNRIYHQPESMRPPCLLILGAPSNGKTHLMHRFRKEHLPMDDPTDGNLRAPVLWIEDMDRPEERVLYNRIIERFGFPNKPNDPIPKLEYKAHRILIHYQVKVLMIDEFNSLANGSPIKQRQFLTTLRTLSNRRKLSIIAAGTRDALGLLQLDTQLSSRFATAPLPPWQMDHAWQALLASFERIIPLAEPSGLADPKFSQRLLAESDATIGDAWELLKLMAVHAIENGATRLNMDMTTKVGWVRPSERVRDAQEKMARAGW